jgi:hypothetical protein
MKDHKKILALNQMQSKQTKPQEPFNLKCPICLSQPMEEEKILLLCNHLYHIDCIKEWTKSCNQKSHNCPLCSQEFDITQIPLSKWEKLINYAQHIIPDADIFVTWVLSFCAYCTFKIAKSEWTPIPIVCMAFLIAAFTYGDYTRSYILPRATNGFSLLTLPTYYLIALYTMLSFYINNNPIELQRMPYFILKPCFYNQTYSPS